MHCNRIIRTNGHQFSYLSALLWKHQLCHLTNHELSHEKESRGSDTTYTLMDATAGDPNTKMKKEVFLTSEKSHVVRRTAAVRVRFLRSK